jgi:hypothetical protein
MYEGKHRGILTFPPDHHGEECIILVDITTIMNNTFAAVAFIISLFIFQQWVLNNKLET